jgi:hydroxylysine kinase
VTQAADLELGWVQGLLLERYGMAGEVTRLGGERDANFRVDSPPGAVVLKVFNAANSAEEVRFQVDLLGRLAGTGVTPTVVPALDGSDLGWVPTPDGIDRAVMMVTFVAGDPIGQVHLTPEVCRGLGEFAATLTRAMTMAPRPPEGEPFHWDLRHAALTRTLLDEVPNVDPLVAQVLDTFIEKSPRLFQALPSQTIHNDLNPDNVLVEVRATAPLFHAIDFGDAVWGPRIVDLAVLCSYLVPEDLEGQWEAVVAVISAYRQVLDLQEDEVASLYVVMLARLATAVAVPSWRAARDPANAG